jgi:hypothetical protein
MIVCKHCGKQIGVVALPEKPVLVDQTEELIRRGVAARCPLCRQAVEVKVQGTVKSFVPHFAASPQRKMCPGSGKPLPAEAPAAVTPQRLAGGKDLSAFMTRDAIRVISCQANAEPLIEELTLEYLDKSDRVRLQIEALRELLGPAFRMQAYPAALKQAQLAVWGNARACVVAGKHEQGGYRQLTDAEVTQVLVDFRQHKQLFFV